MNSNTSTCTRNTQTLTRHPIVLCSFPKPPCASSNRHSHTQPTPPQRIRMNGGGGAILGVWQYRTRAGKCHQSTQQLSLVRPGSDAAVQVGIVCTADCHENVLACLWNVEMGWVYDLVSSKDLLSKWNSSFGVKFKYILENILLG